MLIAHWHDIAIIHFLIFFYLKIFIQDTYTEKYTVLQYGPVKPHIGALQNQISLYP